MFEVTKLQRHGASRAPKASRRKRTASMRGAAIAIASHLGLGAITTASAADLDALYLHTPGHGPIVVDDIHGPERLPRARAEGSVIRIGPASGSGRQIVTDGRVDRPEPRPASEGSLPGGGESGLVVVRQDVRDLIEQVAEFYGFNAVLSRQVRGEVENARLPSDLDMFLDKIAEDRGLVFYFRGRELNGSARTESVSRVIGLGPSDPEELRAAIESAGVDADRFPVQYIEASNSVLVDGPPSFVGLVEVIAESLVRTERSAPSVTVIRGNQIQRSSPDVAAPVAPPAPPAR